MTKLLILALSVAFHIVCFGMLEREDKIVAGARLPSNKQPAGNDALPGERSSKKMKNEPDTQMHEGAAALQQKVAGVSSNEQNPEEVFNTLLVSVTEQELDRRLLSLVRPIATTLPLVKSLILEGFKRRLQQKQEIAQAQDTCDALEQRAANEMLAKEKMKAALLEEQRQIAEQQTCIDTDLKKFIYKELSHE